MKIVTAKEFLLLPKGTVFAKYDPCILDEIHIKQDSIGETDFYYISFSCIDPDDFFKMEEEKVTVPMDVSILRDGLFDMKQLYLVFSTQDVRNIIDVLSETITSKIDQSI